MCTVLNPKSSDQAEFRANERAELLNWISIIRDGKADAAQMALFLDGLEEHLKALP